MRKVAILGYGTVGSGVACVLSEGKEYLSRKVGDTIEVAYVLDLRDFPGDPLQEKVVHDFSVILADPQVEVVAETMGGLHPAYDFVRASLEAGKHVVTSNKQLVEAKGAELGKIARAHGVTFLFEASVGGGIPVLRALNNAMWHEEILGIYGILNGTTNYILNQMENHSVSFADALAQAQEKGYAERDPSADVDGLDAARKIAILASMNCDHHVSFEAIPTIGIRSVDTADMQAARAQGGTLKLIASFQMKKGALYAAVEPQFVPGDCPLSAVNDVFNAVYVHSSMLDDTMFYGRGAGKMATASAVVSDIAASLTGVSQKEMEIWDEEPVEVKDAGELPVPYLFVLPERSWVSEPMTRLQARQALEKEACDPNKAHAWRMLVPYEA